MKFGHYIIGATSGIGLELARILSQHGFTLGLTGRRQHLLRQLKQDLPSPVFTKEMDITKVDQAIAALAALLREMGGTNLIVISAGTGHINTNLDWKLEEETIATNVTGVTALITASMQYFTEVGTGHLAVLSSVASLRGSGDSPAYNASKAYVSNYLEGMRCKAKKSGLDITVTDIKPGLVDTAMAKGEGLFWVMPAQKAASQIYTALQQGQKIAGNHDFFFAACNGNAVFKHSDYLLPLL